MKQEGGAVVVLSGGQDSTTALFWAKENFSRVRAITFDYGQRHSIEIGAAQQVARLAGVDWELISIRGLLHSRSPLTDLDAPLETYESFSQMESVIGNRVELTFVPMRNALMLTVAANYALAASPDVESFSLVTGVCQMDNANYPDCRSQFIGWQQAAINAALGLEDSPRGVRIHTPLMYLSKAETVALARTLPGCWEALAYSHTCYAGKFPPCGVCHACVLRAEGFKQAGYEDPLVERAKQMAVAASTALRY